MLTRSKAKQQNIRPNALNFAAAGLQRYGTIIQTGPSATGQGIHTRWIRPTGEPPASTNPSEPQYNQHEDIDIDERYITPAPSFRPIPGAPQKAKVVPGNKAKAPAPIWSLESMDSIEEDPSIEDESMEEAPILASPFRFFSPASQAQTSHHSQHRSSGSPQHLSNEGNGGSEQNESQNIPHYAAPRRALGPSGTFILDKDGNDVYL